MGVEVLAAAAIIGTGLSVERSMSASREAKRAASRERKARDINIAQGKNERAQAIRQQAREERIARAQIAAQAESSGISGGSAVAGAVGARQTLTAQGQAFATGQTIANEARTDLLQEAAGFRSAAATDQAQGQVYSSVAGLSTAIAGQTGGFESLFG